MSLKNLLRGRFRSSISFFYKYSAPMGQIYSDKTVPEALNIYRRMISSNVLSAVGTRYFVFKIHQLSSNRTQYPVIRFRAIAKDAERLLSLKSA